MIILTAPRIFTTDVDVIPSTGLAVVCWFTKGKEFKGGKYWWFAASIVVPRSFGYLKLSEVGNCLVPSFWTRAAWRDCVWDYGISMRPSTVKLQLLVNCLLGSLVFVNFGERSMLVLPLNIFLRIWKIRAQVRTEALSRKEFLLCNYFVARIYITNLFLLKTFINSLFDICRKLFTACLSNYI